MTTTLWSLQAVKLKQFYLLIYGGRGEREREKERKKEYEKMNGLLFHLFMHSLVDSYMCPDQGLNLQHWHIGTML